MRPTRTLGASRRSGDPLHGIRRVARTRAEFLTERQQHRLAKVFADERHVAFEATRSVYQDAIDACQAPDPALGNKIMARLITSLQTGVPAGLEEVRSLGRTMKRRREDILAFFRPPRHFKTAPPKRSTASSNTSQAQPEESATSPTTSPDPYSTPAGSDPSSTHSCEEPYFFRLTVCWFRTCA